MNYTKGQILTYTYPVNKLNNKELSKVINNYHRVVVLHKRETPFNTVLIAPITSAGSLNKVGKVPSNYVELLVNDYPMILDHDSYINLDMTLVVDDTELNELERYNKKFKGNLKEFDLYQMDYKITLTYELNKYLKTEHSKILNEEFESVISLINENIKVRIQDLVSKIDNVDIAQSIISIIDDFIMELKRTYINNNIEDGKYLKD